MFQIEFSRKSLVLCTAEFFSSFSVFGVMSLLMVLFVYHIKMPQSISYQLIGNFIAVSLVGTIIGGLLYNRYLPGRLSCLLGLMSYTIGYFLLMYYSKLIFICLGFAFVATGFSLFEPNIRILFGSNYKNLSSPQRDTSFIVLHVFNIIGQLLGPILLAYLMIVNPHYMFFAASIFSLMGVIFFIFYYSDIRDIESNIHNKYFISNLSIGVSLVILLLAFSFFVILQHYVKYIFVLLLIPIATFFVFRLPDNSRDIRVKTYAIFLVLVGLFIAELSLRQCFGIIDMFTKSYVNRKIFGFDIHTGLFESVEPFFILAMFPFIIKIRNKIGRGGRYLTSGGSVSFGLLMLSVSFAFLVAGGFFSDNMQVSVLWLLLCYFFMAIGEIFIIPIVTSSIFGWSQDNWKGGMMGMFFITIGLSSYINDTIGKSITTSINNPTLNTYTHLFLGLTIMALVFSVLLFVIWKVLQKKYSHILNA